ncbi:MAG: SIS domain-containing protein [Actinobacteria bacterium]|nr:SIS domain-containing protein [Actinomycetota bacterium]
MLPANLDSLGMRAAALGLPEQVEAAVEAGAAIRGLPEGEEIANICVFGVGASGLAGRIVAALAQEFVPVPVVVAEGYDAPSFVAQDTLAIAVSFSGDTEETIEAAQEAQLAGAHLMVVTRGGRLGALAGEWGAARVEVPAGLPTARAAIGALAVPPLVALERMGLFPGAHGWAAHAVAQLERRRDQLAGGGPARDLARRIGRTLPIVYGASAIGAVAAARWKAQCNENAKVPAFAGAVPQVCHDEVSGWGQHGDVTRQVFSLVLLRHDLEHPQEDRRFALLAEALDEVVADRHVVRAEGEGPLAQLLDLVLFGDLVSLELAAQEGIDPGPVPAIDDIEFALSEPEAGTEAGIEAGTGVGVEAGAEAESRP